MTNVSDIRAMIAMCQEHAFFQSGTYTPKPEPVIAELLRWERLQSEWVGMIPDVGDFNKLLEQVRAKLSGVLNVSPDELALGESTSYGINLVASGIDWKPEDNVIISDQEHPGNLLQWLGAVRRYGAKVRTISPCADYDRMLADIKAQIDDRTRLISLTHVSRYSGLRYPAEEIVELGHAYGVPVLIDGAQSVGPLDIDLKQMGCDYFAFSGHKYLMGPQGTAGLYINSASQHRPEPALMYSPVKWDRAGIPELGKEARRFEYGTRDLGRFGGLVRALELWEDVGWATMRAQIKAYVAALKCRLLDEVPGLALVTPFDPAKSAAIISLKVAGLTESGMVKTLREREQVIITGTGLGNESVRVSCHVFNNDQDAERLVRGLKTMAQDA